MSIYTFPITINSSQVSGTNINFPYLFSEGCSGIPAGFWNHVVDNDGLDIRFYDSDYVSELNREIVLYSSATNKVEARVQIPTLSTSANKTIYCQYGGTTRANDVTTWKADEYVYHMQNNANDSSVNINDAVGYNQIAGKINNGSSAISVLGSNIGGNLDVSLSAWIKVNSLPYDGGGWADDYGVVVGSSLMVGTIYRGNTPFSSISNWKT